MHNSKEKRAEQAGKHFDFIISNPPYKIGNKVTWSVVDSVDFNQYVNLMPASKYKGGELYKHVAEVQSVEDDFEDATVGASLTVATLKKGDVGRFSSFDEFENEKRDPRFREFYRLNATKAAGYDMYNAPKTLDGLDPRKDFQVTVRTVQNGTHKVNGKGARDIEWNIRLDPSAIMWSEYDKAYWCYFVRWNSELEKQNFCRFWYYNPLMNDLIKGLNKTSGSCAAAIPNINYSIERDYEHLTLEDIMTILREE